MISRIFVFCEFDKNNTWKCAIGVVFGKNTVGPFRREGTAEAVGRVDGIVDDGVFSRFSWKMYSSFWSYGFTFQNKLTVVYTRISYRFQTAVSHSLNFSGLASFSEDRPAIDEEFSNVPVITVKPDELPLGAETKNRYANVIPMPETRVMLNPRCAGQNSDYINANFVKVSKTTIHVNYKYLFAKVSSKQHYRVWFV